MAKKYRADFRGLRRLSKPLKALDTAVSIALAASSVDAVMRVVSCSVAPAIDEHLQRSGFLGLFPKAQLRRSSQPDLYRLAGVSRSRDSLERWPDNIGVDHQEMWNLNRKPVLFCYHPYDLDRSELIQLTAFCVEHRLGLFLTAYSPYFPTRTPMVVIYKKKRR